MATGTPTTVDVDFLDSSSNSVYTLKGEVFVQTTPMQSDNVYMPDKLTGGPKYISKLRIKAGESGMVLKLFDNELSTVPKLIVLLTEGFLSSASTLQPIEIDFMQEYDPVSNGYKIIWYNRNIDEFKRTNGMHVGKLEVHVERMEKAQLMPVKTFGIVSYKSKDVLMPEAMNLFAQEPSLIQAPNTVYVPAAKYPNMYAQYPNAPQYAA